MNHSIKKAMILAAGEGTRLRPLTLTVPKPMLAVSGRPTLEWIIRWLKHYGVESAVINLHHQPQPVLDYFADGERQGVDIHFSVEETMLGTAGGIKRVEDRLQPAFVLIYGDMLTDMDLSELFAYHRDCCAEPHITMMLSRAPNPWECGVVSIDESGRVMRFVEKPPRDEIFSDLTNAGILVIDGSILAEIPESGFSDVSRDLIPKLLQKGTPIYAREMQPDDYAIDIGTPDKFERAQNEWPTERAKKWA
jgi:NDP-sugar pyrophosphorylase family protein